MTSRWALCWTCVINAVRLTCAPIWYYTVPPIYIGPWPTRTTCTCTATRTRPRTTRPLCRHLFHRLCLYHHPRLHYVHHHHLFGHRIPRIEVKFLRSLKVHP